MVGIVTGASLIDKLTPSFRIRDLFFRGGMIILHTQKKEQRVDKDNKERSATDGT
jgi:hypothetical protein